MPKQPFNFSLFLFPFAFTLFRVPEQVPVLVERLKPEDFLRLIEKSRLGKLKIYLGHGAGVGKTYAMLEEGHRLKKAGVDVVIGWVETHGRKDTEALLEGLEIIPRKKVQHGNTTVEI